MLLLCMFVFAQTLLFLDREYEHIVLVHYRETSKVSSQNMISDKHGTCGLLCVKRFLLVQHISLTYTPPLFLKTKMLV